MFCSGLNRMQFIDRSGRQIVAPAFSQQVKQSSGVKLDRCYQCLTCTLGCPVAFAMDYHPNQIIRMVQLGLKQQVLSSSTIWICAGCETCVSRCPNEVDILRVMDALREIALQEKIRGKEITIPAFHQTFLDSVRRFGQQHELSMLLLLKLKTRDIFSDIGLGMRMFLKGKLKLLPPRVKGLKEIRAIFEKAAQSPMEDRKSVY